MYKCIPLLCFFIANNLAAQSSTKINSDAEKDTSASSSAEVNMGITNSAFSQHSSALSANALSQKLFLVPAVSYYHKSGFGITANTYFDFESGAKNPFQYSISPNYDYTKNKNFAIGASYNYYFGRDAASKYSSPYQHELYGYYTNKQGWLNWGLAADFSTGKSTTTYSKDSIATNAAGVQRTIKLSATANSKTTDFIISPTIGHEFKFKEVLFDNDSLSIKPAFMLNIATGKYSATYSGNVNSFALTQLKAKKRNVKALSGTDNTPMQFQSTAFETVITYQIGKFSVMPDLYVEYFLPKTESRFNYIYTVNVSYSF